MDTGYYDTGNQTSVKASDQSKPAPEKNGPGVFLRAVPTVYLETPGLIWHGNS